MKIVKPSATLLWITPDAEKAIERAGRTCYKSEDKITEESAGEFIRKIIASGHESVIEHASASYLLVCDRGVSHEAVRHRICSFSQESTRYVNYSKGKFGGEISVIEPPGLSENSHSGWFSACSFAEDIYMKMLADGCSPQIARSVLPNSLKTEIATTANLREWRHIFRLRTSPKAHPQMREVAAMVLADLKERCPNVFFDINA
jgi:thymidylate synthase (FAD)